MLTFRLSNIPSFLSILSGRMLLRGYFVDGYHKKTAAYTRSTVAMQRLPILGKMPILNLVCAAKRCHTFSWIGLQWVSGFLWCDYLLTIRFLGVSVRAGNQHCDLDKTVIACNYLALHPAKICNNTRPTETALVLQIGGAMPL